MTLQKTDGALGQVNSPKRRDYAALRGYAGSQHGAFTLEQALACGWTAHEIRYAVLKGWWRRLTQGVYVDADVWAALDAAGQHRCTVAGRLATKGSAWFAARRSAALFHELPLLGDLPKAPQLLRDLGPGLAHSRDEHERIAALTADEGKSAQGVRVTSLARIVLDIAREQGWRPGVVAADGALRRGLEREELLSLARQQAVWPGGSQGLRLAHFADGLAESVLESISRAPLPELQIAVPELQIQIWWKGELVARVDQLWRDVNTIGQGDGALKYQDLPVAAALARVRADKRQDEQLESLGFEVVRWGWEEAWEPALMGGRLLRAFVRGAAQTIDPGVRFVTTTVAQSVAWARRYDR